MTLFAASWLLRRRGTGRAAALAFQGMGAAVMTAAGWMGGTLVFRNQIGVDHRYAGAGRWQENTIDHRADLALVAKTSPLQVNQMELVHADGERIVVARTETGIAAFEDRCTHKGGPLSDGVLMCGTVQCPWHGSQFDVDTGAVKCGPARRKIRTYPLEG
jgi:nitrite reductase/ring-hydroxylating ferredoxin subunit